MTTGHRHLPAQLGFLAATIAAVIAIAPFSRGQDQTAQTAPLAQWYADGNADDSSGNGNDGTQLGQAGYAPGLSGQAFDLDGQSGGIKTTLDTHPANRPAMTWSAWVLPLKIGAKRQILSSDNGGYKRSLLLLEDRFVVFTGNQLWETPEIADPGAWQHVAVVFDGTTVRFYKNGHESSFEQAVPAGETAAPLCIGCSPTFGEHFGGLIDEVEIHGRALGADEINAIYNKLRPKAESVPAVPVIHVVSAQAAQAALADAAAIAQRAVTEPWDAPQAFSDKPAQWRIDGYRNSIKGGSSSDHLGSVTLLLFLDGGKVESPLLPAAESLQSEGLKVVVLTPAFPAKPEAGKKEASVEDGLRALVPTIPKEATILSDPYGSVRYQLGLFAAPAVLFDKKGRIIWQTRIGQRETLENAAEFENVARLALKGQIKEMEKPFTKRAITPTEKEIFGFENGWEGWTVAGDAWNPPDETVQGPSSERHIPGLVAGFLGRRWISSFAGNCFRGTGVATSPEFEISAPYLHFLAGGGDIAQNEGIALEVDGKIVRSFTPKESTYELKPARWDVSGLAGKKARIVIYDAGQKEQRDGIMADAFTLSSSPETPKAFADRHDPNNLAHVARVSGDYPETWCRLLAGEFYQKPTPTWTFEIERVMDAKPRPNSGRTLMFDWIGITEKNPIQEASNQKLSIEVDGVPGTSKNIKLPGTIYAKEMLTAENIRTPRKSLQVRISAQVAINEPEFKMGKNPDYKPLTKEEMKATAGISISKDILKFLEGEKILRWPQETDRAYILRVWRYIQRYYTDWAAWGGWPIPKNLLTNGTLPFGSLGGLCSPHRK